MMSRVIPKSWSWAFLLALFSVSTVHAQTPEDDGRYLEAEHGRGVDLARSGQYDQALILLEQLLAKHPDYYPLERDIIIIYAWKGDCRTALRKFEKVRDQPDPEAYLILPVSECMVRHGRIQEAVAILNDSRQRAPDDAELENAYNNAMAKLAAKLLYEFRAEAGTDTSDQGKREWLMGATLARHLSDRTQIYVRYATSLSGYDAYQSGKSERVGVGIQHEFRNSLVFTQEFSGDMYRGGQSGSLTSLVYLPTDLWRLGASHTTYAEDIPLRAKAERISAKRSVVFTDFHTAEYRWSWLASASRYEFSDSNNRAAYFTSLGYAYELAPKREQRVFLELYQSNNTLADAVYYNPIHDRNLSVVHKTDFVFDSRFRRHVDHLYLSLGSYDQQGYATRGVWGVRYEQDYDFTDRVALLVGAGYGRHVYDGAGEYETSLNAVFRWLF